MHVGCKREYSENGPGETERPPHKGWALLKFPKGYADEQQNEICPGIAFFVRDGYDWVGSGKEKKLARECHMQEAV